MGCISPLESYSLISFLFSGVSCISVWDWRRHALYFLWSFFNIQFWKEILLFENLMCSWSGTICTHFVKLQVVLYCVVLCCTDIQHIFSFIFAFYTFTPLEGFIGSLNKGFAFIGFVKFSTWGPMNIIYNIPNLVFSSYLNFRTSVPSWIRVVQFFTIF